MPNFITFITYLFMFTMLGCMRVTQTILASSLLKTILGLMPYFLTIKAQRLINTKISIFRLKLMILILLFIFFILLILISHLFFLLVNPISFIIFFFNLNSLFRYLHFLFECLNLIEYDICVCFIVTIFVGMHTIFVIKYSLFYFWPIRSISQLLYDTQLICFAQFCCHSYKFKLSTQCRNTLQDNKQLLIMRSSYYLDQAQTSSYMDNVQDPVIKQQIQPVQLNWNRGQNKALIVNVPTQKSDSHFGKVTINAKIDGEQRVKNQQKKQKWEFQTLKMEIQSQKKKNKTFSLSLPINRGVKRSSDSKIHFLFQLTEKNALLTIVDDYVDCRMSIKGKSLPSFSQVIELQKRKLDRRRKNSYEEDANEGKHNDPDFKDQAEQEGND